MKYLKGNYHTDKYSFHPNENFIIGLRDRPKSLRTQYQIQNDRKIRTKKGVINDQNDELEIKLYPKKTKS